MTIITAPLCRTVEEAIDFLQRNGCGPQIRLWRGPDGWIRGVGVVQ